MQSYKIILKINSKQLFNKKSPSINSGSVLTLINHEKEKVLNTLTNKLIYLLNVV